MKHIISIFFVFASALYSFAQVTYESLIENKAFINIDKETVLLPTAGEYWETQSLKKLRAILGNDLFYYFDLSDEYSTQLQRQTFEKSEEYTQNLLPAFNKIKQSVKNAKFYTLFNLRYNESYDVSKRCFHFRIGVNDYNTTTTSGYIGLGNCFCITYPSTRTKITKSRTSYGDYFLQQYLTSPTIPEEIALRIEKEIEDPYCSIALMFIVKPTKVTSEKRTMNLGGYVGTQNITNQNILANTVGLYIVDTNSKEVLCDLSRILNSPTPQRKTSAKKSK